MSLPTLQARRTRFAILWMFGRHSTSRRAGMPDAARSSSSARAEGSRPCHA
jgi:hypothetical protein